MSGRKASEVNALLNHGEKTRSGSMGLLNSAKNRAENAIEEAKKAENKAVDCISKLNLTSDFDIVKKEFPEAAEDINKRLSSLSSYSASDFTEYNSAKNEADSVMSEYTKIDAEAESVRQKIKKKIGSQGRTDAWYCDEEFKEADKVKEKYDKAAGRVNSVTNKFNIQSSLANKAISVANSKMEQAQKLDKDIKNLRDKAGRIVKLRAEASKAKDEVSKTLSSIDKGIAEKFLSSEYNEITKAVSDYLNTAELKGDQFAVEHVSEILGSIAAFTSKLEKIYAEYLERKNGVRSSIDSATERINRKDYTRPDDEISQDNPDKHSLCEFLEEYADGKYISDIETLINKAEKAFQDDDFNKADSYISDAADLTNKACELSSKLHENRMKSFIAAITTQNVLQDMGYDVYSEMNDPLSDGFKLICSAGDERITFDKITVDETGKPIITIFHEEGTAGTCKGTMRNIAEAMAEEGLFFEDITKDGKSVLSPTTQTKSAGNNEKATNRG